MNSTELCNNTFFNSVPSPQKNSTSKCHDNDDVAILLDSVPELDNMFIIKKKIGYGTFSSVYLGYLKPKVNSHRKNYYAIKHIIPTSHPSKIFMELKCLKLMGGKDNIIEATLCLRHMNHIVLVMPYFSHDFFSDYVGNLTTEEIRDYILNLLKALEKVHSYNIIHRDIKPSNFLYSRKHRRYALIDFGLAQDLSKEYKEQASIKRGLEKKFSCPLMDTPQITLSKPVKRKLAIPCIASSDTPLGIKKSRLIAPTVNISPNNFVFSTSNRINSKFMGNPTSPSKVSPNSKSSHKKENTPVVSKEKQDETGNILNDSPSKHTRQAEAFRYGKNTSKNDSLKESLTSYGKIVSPNKSLLRRSPRKPNSNRLKFLKGINGSVTSSGSYARNSYENCFAASTSGYSISGTRNSDTRDGRRTSSVSQEDKTRTCRSVLCPTSCRCYGSAKVCSVCLGRKNQHAPRAGTPGFRAPEVLVRHPNQTTGVDIWSAGVILLCLASGRYPFFRPVDDISSLAEITTIFGSRVMRKISAYLGKLFTPSEELPPLNLRKICYKLRLSMHRSINADVNNEKECCKGCKQFVSECICLSLPNKSFSRLESNIVLGSKCPKDSANRVMQSDSGFCTSPSINVEEQSSKGTRKEIGDYPSSLYALMYKLLDPNPYTRISAKDALLHPFFVRNVKKEEQTPLSQCNNLQVAGW